MKMIKALPDSPENIDDIVLLERAMLTLEHLTKKYGVAYSFIETQDPLGGTCKPAPEGYSPSRGRIIRSYGQDYFAERLKAQN